MGGIVFVFFKIQNAIMKGGIRSDEEDEIAGLDLPEMGVSPIPSSTWSKTLVHLGNGDGTGAEPVKEPEIIG